MAREIQLASPVGQEDTRTSASDSDDKRASAGAAADATDDEQAQLVERNALDGVRQPSGDEPSANAAPAGHGKQAERSYAAPISSRVAGLCALVVAAVTCFAVYDLTVSAGEVSPGAQRRRVLWYGWITAVSTGFGVVPFFFLGTLQPWWVAVCNAVAAGMMISASIGLVTEGASMAPDDFPWFPVWLRAIMGTVAGGLFIIATQRWLEKYEDLKFSGFSGASAKKMLVIMAVMTVHSFTEGVGIGVAFAGESGHHFGVFISTTLAIHNIPEGLAICLVLIPRGVSLLVAALWAVVSSLPQPLMALPAFVFVQEFLPLLPCGLGFAAGAMVYVALFELLSEALEELRRPVALATCALSAVAMGLAQHVLR